VKKIKQREKNNKEMYLYLHRERAKGGAREKRDERRENTELTREKK